MVICLLKNFCESHVLPKFHAILCQAKKYSHSGSKSLFLIVIWSMMNRALREHGFNLSVEELCHRHNQKEIGKT